MIDLILQQLGGLIEQIDRHQAVGKPADHLVAAGADRRELAEIVEQSQRIDRRHGVAFRSIFLICFYPIVKYNNFFF